MIYTIPKNTYENWLLHITEYEGIFNEVQQVVYFYSVSYGDFETACNLLINTMSPSLYHFYLQDKGLLKALHGTGFFANEMMEYNPSIMFKPGYHPSIMRRPYFSNIDFTAIANSMKVIDIEEFKKTSVFEQFLLNYFGDNLKLTRRQKFSLIERELTFMDFRKEANINLTFSKWIKYFFIATAIHVVVSSNEDLSSVYLGYAENLLSDTSKSMQRILNLYHYIMDEKIPYLQILKSKDRKVFNIFIDRLSGYDSRFAHVLACN